MVGRVDEVGNGGVAGVVLVLGGTRSGKSAAAERIASASGMAVTYVATGADATATDPQWRARVAAHRARRPHGWHTLEIQAGGDLAGALERISGTALVDSLGTWLAGCGSLRPTSLCDALGARTRLGMPTVVVSEEVGLGVHPATELGRRFADDLGTLNQAVASVAARVVLVVAGRTLELGGSPQ